MANVMYRVEGRGYVYGDMGDRGFSFVDENLVFKTIVDAKTYLEQQARATDMPFEVKDLKWKGLEMSGDMRGEVIPVKVMP